MSAEKNSRNTKRLTLAGMFLALGIAVPQAIHGTGIPQVGNMFLPMHIPVLVAGYCLGPIYGGVIGFLCPFISAFFGMPPVARAPFMMGELAAYGAISGALYRKKSLRERRSGIYAVLLLSMIGGRAVYAVMLAVAAWGLGIPCGGPAAAVTATVTGLPGIGIQLILVPALVLACEKGGLLDGVSERGA